MGERMMMATRLSTNMPAIKKNRVTVTRMRVAEGLAPSTALVII